MITGATATPCFPNSSQGLQLYGVSDDSVSANPPAPETHPNSLLYSLSHLKEKVHQVQSLITIFISPDPTRPSQSTAMAVASMATLIQEIIVTASSMMFTCQQMTLSSAPPPTHNTNCGGGLPQPSCATTGPSVQMDDHFYPGETLDWLGENYNTCNANNNEEVGRKESTKKGGQKGEGGYDIIELDAADLLAKYTHYCQVCGKGFKRDANLRMHMRAHGDEYKSSAALSNPVKGGGSGGEKEVERKYSCPQEGCRWNRKHAKFQPLKSMICVKNHYKRSHCPKMYVCKRCNRKQFSVLSDLRTHEKHCGDQKWRCSCGTTFSRKDKLMGHVALFVGHSPAVGCLDKIGKVEVKDQLRRVDSR